MRNKKNVILPPQLPPDISDDEIEISDEDEIFVSENKDYAGFISTLDTPSITKHVTRVADVKEDTVEALYEQRRKKSLLKEESSGIEANPVDALSIKDSSGILHYLKAPKNLKTSEIDLEGTCQDDEDDAADKGIVKLTKAERRAKQNKLKKEAKNMEKILLHLKLKLKLNQPHQLQCWMRLKKILLLKKDLKVRTNLQSWELLYVVIHRPTLNP